MACSASKSGSVFRRRCSRSSRVIERSMADSARCSWQMMVRLGCVIATCSVGAIAVGWLAMPRLIAIPEAAGNAMREIVGALLQRRVLQGLGGLAEEGEPAVEQRGR